MAEKYEVLPLESNPYYSYTFSLNKIAYNFTYRYSTRESCWYMDIKNNDNTPIIVSVKLVPNYPMLDGLSLGELSGDFYLFPLVQKNISKYISEPFNISEYFQLVYIYQD